MTESQFTQKLLKVLRTCGSFEQVWKLSDRLTAGLPDFLTWRYGKATPCEVKLIGARSKMFVPLQLETLRRVKGWYIVHDPAKRLSWLFRADENEEWSKDEPLKFDELVEKIRRIF